MQQTRAEAATPAAVPPAPKPLAQPTQVLPLRYALFALAVVLLVAGGQLVEDAFDTPTLEMLTPLLSIPRWTLVLLTFFMLFMLWLIQRTARMALERLRPTVLCTDEVYEGYRAELSRVPWLIDLGLLVISAGLVILFFPILQNPLPVVRNPLTHAYSYLPQDPVGAFPILVGYTLVIWAGFSLLVSLIRMANGLRKLTEEPMAINVYDVANVLPLGHMAITLMLAPVGFILILVIGLGLPTGVLSWIAYIAASLAGILTLTLTLRGVHHQMVEAQSAVLARLNQDLLRIQSEVLQSKEPDAPRAAHLAALTSTVVSLRKAISDEPTWPFRGAFAITRVTLIAFAPLIYTILNELLRILVIDPLVR